MADSAGPQFPDRAKLRQLKLWQLALAQTQLWSGRTTLNGVPRLIEAQSIQRKLCWLVIMLAISAMGVVHLVESVNNFLNSGLASQIRVDAAPAEFPGVTVCSLKPASESLLAYYRPVVARHLERYFGYFDAWFAYQRRQGREELHRDYRLRIVKVLAQLIEVLWVSDDTRDLSLMDRTSILECRFNGQPCHSHNFTLLQHYHRWNCYMFSPHPSLRYENPTAEHDAGLMLNMFADSNFFASSYRTNLVYNQSMRHSKQDYRVDGLSLRQFLTELPNEFPLNRLLDANNLETDGVQVILHPADSYPMFHQTRYTVKSSASAMFQVFSMERNRINQAASPCSSEPLGTIDYVAAFGHQPNDVTWRTFDKGVEDVFHVKVQDSIYQRCGCYSHRIAFRVNKAQLCYYVPPEYRKVPSTDVLGKIYCHDVWHQKLMKEPRRADQTDDDDDAAVSPCHQKYSEVQYKSTRWPSDEDLVSVTILYFLHRFANGTEFTNPKDPHDHRLFNFTDPEVAAVATNHGQRRLSSRENVAIRSLLLPRCAGMREFNEKNLAETAACLNKEAVRRNLLRIRVRLASPAATVYNESYSYTRMEFLSEVGGVLGLWFGVSVLTFVEFFELIYLIIRSKRRIDKTL